MTSISSTHVGGNPCIKDNKGIYETEHPMSYPLAIYNVFGKCNIDTYDIRSDSLAAHKEDYLKTKLNYQPDMIMLLRLNFLGSKERFPFFKDNIPEYIIAHHKRICFCEKHDKDGYLIFGKNGLPKRGSTDSIEYAHMVWRKGYNPEFAKLKVI